MRISDWSSDVCSSDLAGTASMIAAAAAADVGRFVHVSSLAAREPELSAYGRSKAESEKLMAESGLDWAIVRPPAVYGPGDRGKIGGASCRGRVCKSV